MSNPETYVPALHDYKEYLNKIIQDRNIFLSRALDTSFKYGPVFTSDQFSQARVELSIFNLAIYTTDEKELEKDDYQIYLENKRESYSNNEKFKDTTPENLPRDFYGRFIDHVEKKFQMNYSINPFLKDKNLFWQVHFAPVLWVLLHTFAAKSYFEEDEESMFCLNFGSLFHCLSVFISCPICKEHFNENVNKFSFERVAKNGKLYSKLNNKTIEYELVLFHEYVNKNSDLGSRYSGELDVYSFIEHYRKGCVSVNNLKTLNPENLTNALNKEPITAIDVAKV